MRIRAGACEQRLARWHPDLTIWGRRPNFTGATKSSSNSCIKNSLHEPSELPDNTAVAAAPKWLRAMTKFISKCFHRSPCARPGEHFLQQRDATSRHAKNMFYNRYTLCESRPPQSATRRAYRIIVRPIQPGSARLNGWRAMSDRRVRLEINRSFYFSLQVQP